MLMLTLLLLMLLLTLLLLMLLLLIMLLLLMMLLQNVGFPTLYRQCTAVAHLCVSHACLLIGSLRRTHIVWPSISPGTLEHNMRHIPPPLERLLLLMLFSPDCLVSPSASKVVRIP